MDEKACLARAPGLTIAIRPVWPAHRWCGILLVSLLATAACHLGESSEAQRVVFQAEGVIERRCFKPDGRIYGRGELDDVPDVIAFQVAVSNSSWFIVSRFGPRYWIECGCDGINEYQLLQHPEGRLEGGLAQVKPGAGRNLLDHWASTVWLALASGDYFTRSNAHELAAPWSTPETDPWAHVYVANGIFTNDTYPLPVMLWFVTARDRLADAPRRSELRGAQVKPPAAVLASLLAATPVGKTGGVYRASDWTLAGGVWIPRRFELENYYLHADGGGSASSLRVACRVIGRVTNVTLRVDHVGAPVIRGVAGVTDFRFRDRDAGVDFINYLATNVWPSTNEPWLLALFDETRSRRLAGLSFHASSQSNDGQGARRGVVLGALMLLGIVSCLFWFRCIFTQRSPKGNGATERR